MVLFAATYLVMTKLRCEAGFMAGTRVIWIGIVVILHPLYEFLK